MAAVNDLRCGRPRVTADLIVAAASVGQLDNSARQFASHPSPFDATATWRMCKLEGYLLRKLHRQWRCRGS